MTIEESILIHAPLTKVWETFTHITSWKDWNTVLTNVSRDRTEIMAEGGKVRLCIHPFHFPVYLEPVIEKVVPGKEVSWSSEKYGVSALHLFTFKEVKKGVLVTSREKFRGIPVKALGFLFPRSRLRKLTVSFLKELKGAAEN